MDKKNKKPKRTFIPQSIGDTLRKVNRNFSSKFGKIEFIIHSKWPDIVGSYFKIYSEPKNITRLPDYENDLGETIYKSHLNVNVAPAAALEFQHFKDTIIEKINSYFGYKLIDEIKLQTFGSEINKKKEKKIIGKFSKNLHEKISEIKSKSIKNSLSQLLKTIKND